MCDKIEKIDGSIFPHQHITNKNGVKKVIVELSEPPNKEDWKQIQKNYLAEYGEIIEAKVKRA